MSRHLEPPPPDLTRLQDRYGDKMDTEKVYRIIDGRHSLPGHGPRQMPVWGFSFQTLEMDSDQEKEVRWRIESLVLYLETIQRPAAAGSSP